MSKIDAVLLDAAGTLIEPAEPVADTYARFARRFGTEIAPERLMCAFRDGFAAMPPMAFSEFSLDSLDALERDWWRSLVAEVIARSGEWSGISTHFLTASTRTTELERPGLSIRKS